MKASQVDVPPLQSPSKMLQKKLIGGYIPRILVSRAPWIKSWHTGKVLNDNEYLHFKTILSTIESLFGLYYDRKDLSHDRFNKIWINPKILLLFIWYFIVQAHRVYSHIHPTRTRLLTADRWSLVNFNWPHKPAPSNDRSYTMLTINCECFL